MLDVFMMKTICRTVEYNFYKTNNLELNSVIVGEKASNMKKKVRFDGSVNSTKKENNENVKKNATYADMVRMTEIKDTKYVDQSIQHFD